MLSSYPRAGIPFLMRYLPTPTCSAKHPCTYTINVIWYRHRVYWTRLTDRGVEHMWSPERSPYSPGWAHSIVAGNPVQRSPEPVTVYIFTGIDVEVGSSRAGVVLNIYTPKLTIENGRLQKVASFRACVLGRFRSV